MLRVLTQITVELSNLNNISEWEAAILVDNNHARIRGYIKSGLKPRQIAEKFVSNG